MTTQKVLFNLTLEKISIIQASFWLLELVPLGVLENERTIWIHHYIIILFDFWNEKWVWIWAGRRLDNFFMVRLSKICLSRRGSLVSIRPFLCMKVLNFTELSPRPIQSTIRYVRIYICVYICIYVCMSPHVYFF